MPPKISDPKKRAEFESFIAAIFSSSSLDELRSHLTEVTVPQPYSVRVKVLYCRKPFEEQFRDFQNDGRISTLGAGGSSFQLEDLVGKAHPRRLLSFFALLPTKSPNVAAAVSICAREQWRSVLRYFRHRYPSLVPIFLSQKELIEGVLTLKRESSRYDIRVREVSYKERVGAGESERTKSGREWTDEALEDVLANIQSRQQVISSLTLDYYRRVSSATDVSPRTACRVRKVGEVEISGAFQTAWETIISHVAHVGAQKLAFFSNRGLRERSYKSAPLAVRFTSPAFASDSDVRSFVDIIARYPRSMHAVQHGNPYAHVQVCDVYDGSSFDVWAVDDKNILIVPRLEGTEAAIERLVDYIFNEFREGEVEEFGRVA